MKSDKPMRSIDKMGRIVIPNDMRKMTGLNVGDEVTLEFCGSGILIIPVTKHCVLCGSKYELSEYNSKYICKSCIKTLKMS